MTVRSIELEVRRSRPEDGPPLRWIALSIITAFNLGYDPELLEYGVVRARTLAELVAVRPDGEVVGTITVTRHPSTRGAAWISKFFVDPLHRGEGVGKALLAAAVDVARSSGATFVELMTLVVFRDAIKMYEGHGFRRRPLRRGVQHAARHERRYVLDLEVT